MQIASIPYKFQDIWADAATTGYLTDPIPDTATGGNASQSLGFPPITATPIASGGIPPNIADMNGVLYYVTAWANWQQAGGPIPYDGTFSTNFGGYPQGAMLQVAGALGDWWVSTVDNNASDPDTGGANWKLAPSGRIVGYQVYNTAGTYTYTPPAGAQRFFIRALGGGGGGGGASGPGADESSVGSGGNSGCYAFGEIIGAISGTVTVTVGAGGAGNTGANGSAGGQSSFGAYVIVPGGNGGLGPVSGTNAGGIGIAATPSPNSSPTGTALIHYQIGNRGDIGISAGTSISNSVAGGGGDAWEFGTGGNNVTAENSGSAGTFANNAFANGAGGSGALSVNGGGPAAGGSGAPGYVEIWALSS